MSKYKKIDQGTFKFEDKVITLKNYKEPLREIPKGEGFGWFGTLAGTIGGEFVQCHMCGLFFRQLPFHIQSTHKIRVRDYREKYGIGYTTALVSETQREISKQKTLQWIKGLSEEEKTKLKERLSKGRKVRRNIQPKKTLEQKNKEGTCPDQLLEKVKQVRDKLGRVPSRLEFIEECKSRRFLHLIQTTYGSWTKALEFLKYEPRKSETMGKKGNNKKVPTEVLLEYLNVFARENQKVPTFTDFKRGWLPSYDTYTRRFGSIEKARQMAGVYEAIDKNKPDSWETRKEIKAGLRAGI